MKKHLLIMVGILFSITLLFLVFNRTDEIYYPVTAMSYTIVDNQMVADKFSMDIAENWNIQALAGVTFLNAPSGGSNVNILREYRQGLSFEDYSRILLNNKISIFNEVTDLNYYFLTINGQRAFYKSFTNEISSITRFIFDDGIFAFVITYIEAWQNEYLDEFFQMVHSFRLVKYEL